MEVASGVRKLKERKGEAALIQTAALVLFMMMLISGLMQYVKMNTMIIGLKDYVSQALLQTADINAYNVYSGVRQGVSAAYAYAGNGYWNEQVSTGEVTTRLKETLGMEESGNGLYKYKDGVEIYSITNMQIYCNNAPLAGDDTMLTFITKAEVSIRLNFGIIPFYVTVPIEMTSYYTPLF